MTDVTIEPTGASGNRIAFEYRQAVKRQRAQNADKSQARVAEAVWLGAGFILAVLVLS